MCFKETKFMYFNLCNELYKSLSGLFKKEYPLPVEHMIPQGEVASDKFHIALLTFSGVGKNVVIFPAVSISVLGSG